MGIVMTDIPLPTDPGSNNIETFPRENPAAPAEPVQTPQAPDEGAGDISPDEVGGSTPDEMGDGSKGS